MNSVLGKLAAKKTMRVATAFAGTVAGVAAFAPAARANSRVPQPYTIWVNTADSVGFIQVCGYKDTGKWYCTSAENNPHYGTSATNYFGTGWIDGKVNVWEWGSIAGFNEHGHTCNTSTGAYHGVFRTGGVSLSGGSHAPLGLTNVEC